MALTTITVKETLVDEQGNNLVGYLKISNPAFIVPQGSTLAVTDATDATPIVITVASTSTLTNGDSVYITGVGGNTAANGTWRVANKTGTTFELEGSVGNGGYTSGGTVQLIYQVGAKTLRYPTSGTFNGTITVSLAPTATAIAIPSGSAAGFTYLVQYNLTDGSQYYENWTVATTPSQQTISSIRTPATLNPTATVALSQLAQTSASDTRTNVIYWNGSQWTAGPLNILVNAQTGTSYTVLDSDRMKLLTFSNTSAIAVTLPQAGSSTQFISGWFAVFSNIGLGEVTITPSTSTIDGQTTLKLRIGQSVTIASDGTNYFSSLGAGLTNGANPVNNLRALFTSTADRTQASTASEVTIIGTGVGSLTLPANFHDAAGSSLYVIAAGYYSNTLTPTLRVKLKYGSTILWDSGAVTTTTGATNWMWFFRALITCRSQGAGTVKVQGELLVETGANLISIYPAPNTGTSSITTTATQVVDLTIQWGTSDAANTITGSNFAMFPVCTPL